MSKLVARNRVAFVRELANKEHHDKDRALWGIVRGWTLKEIEAMLGSSMTESGIKAKCIAEAKRQLTIAKNK